MSGRPGMNVAEYLLPDDADARLQLEVALGQLGEDLLPWEVSVEQLPKRLSHGDQTLELEVRQVFEGDRFAKILVIARNVTERVRGEDAERSAREQQHRECHLRREQQGTRTRNARPGTASPLRYQIRRREPPCKPKRRAQTEQKRHQDRQTQCE